MNTRSAPQTQDQAGQRPWLLCFAHRAEAREFLKEFSFRPISLQEGPLSDFYHAKIQERECYLLIHSEGLISANQTVSLCLGHLWPLVPRIINYGVAAGLRPEVKEQKLFSVKTVYAQKQNQQMHFHSSTLEGEIDCVSASERVLDEAQVAYLSAFAPIAEREIWGICQAAQALKAPVEAYKWISDSPWKQSDNQEICQRVKEMSDLFGQAFVDHFKKRLERDQNDSETIEQATEREDPLGIIQHPQSHFSLTQKRQYLHLLQSLSLKEAALLLEFETQALNILSENKEQKKRPKEATPKILQAGHDLLWPYEKRLRKKLQELALPFEKAGAQISFDPQREQTDFTLKARIQHPKHLTALKKAIEEFQYEDFKNIMNGQEHV